MPSAQEYLNSLRRLAIAPPRVCLPAPHVNLNRWAVLACDQHTSEPEYWNDVARFVGTEPSALHCILPEAHLEAPDVEQRISHAQSTMREYLEDGTLVEHDEMFILVRRTLSDGTRRDGLLVTIDLDQYDYRPGSKTPVRATEKTIESRIPARTRIRRGAAIELPHILVLVDDPKDLLFYSLLQDHEHMKRLYSTPLMYHGGHVEGYQIADDNHLQNIAEALERLADPERMRARYGTEETFLFPVGDGNHSLAAAKQYWEERKAAGAEGDNPARFAMVELVNLHGDGLPFHPIHRSISGITEAELQLVLTQAGFSPVEGTAGDPPADIALHGPAGRTGYRQEERGSLSVALVDGALQQLERARIDYIHGEEAIKKTVENGDFVIELPSLDRDSLLSTVVRYGTLPRKAFSLGRAMDKRYYLEARRLDR